MGPSGDILFTCRRSEENLTKDQEAPDVLPPYAAYAPPGTPQVGLGRPLSTAMAQLPLPPPASLVLTQGQLRKGASPGSQLHSRRICLGPHSLATPFAHHLVIQQTLMGPAQGQA